MHIPKQKLSVFLLASVAVQGSLVAKDKRGKARSTDPQDEIAVESHIPVANGPITHFIATSHYGKSYIYAEHATGSALTLIDITNPGKPIILGDVQYPAGATSNSLVAVAGTAALASDASAYAKPMPTQTIRIMDLSDPTHPKVTRQFDGVTATEKVSGGNVILLANPEGIWILSQHLAEDPEVEKRYAKTVLYQ